MPGPALELEAANLAALGARFEPTATSWVSPVILDLDGDGLPGVAGGEWRPHPGTDLARARLVAFDIDGDGFEDLTEWLTGGDGLLVDPEDPGKVVPGAAGFAWSGRLSGRDLLGTAGGWRTGFQKLARRDADSDGIVSGDELRGLYVWVDGDFDAAVGLAELRDAAALGLRALELPGLGEEVGRFVAREGAGALWDWWPSYAIAKRIGAGGLEPPSAVPLRVRSLPPDMLPFLWILPWEEGLRGPKWAKKETLDMVDWETLAIVALAPDGSRLLLRDREPDPAAIAGGSGVRLWVLWELEEGLGMKKISLPFGDIHQAVFASPERAFIVGDTGSKIAAVEFPSLECALLDPADATGLAYRTGSVAFRDGGSAFFTDCYFSGDRNRDGEPETTPQLLLRLEAASDPPSLVSVAEMERVRSGVRAFGDVAAELPASSDLFFFAVRDKERPDSLSAAAWRSGEATVLDRRIRPGTLAASGSRVLYVRDLEGREGGAGEAVVKDAATGETFVLARGDFTYPYLEADGTYAFLTSIDWVSNTMTLLGVPVGGGVHPRELLTVRGIGAVRVSADGNTFACLAPDGLYWGNRLAFAEAGLFLRGNADGSALPPLDPQAAIDISDPIYLLNYLFSGGPEPPCRDAADATDDGALDISDAIRILSHLFIGGEGFRRLSSPWPYPGLDPTEDALDCRSPQA